MSLVYRAIKATFWIVFCLNTNLIHCQGIGDSIYCKKTFLKTESKQIQNSNGTYEFCDSNQDGLMPFDLAQIKNDVLNENALLMVPNTGVYICNSGSAINLITNLSSLPQINSIGIATGPTFSATIDIATNLNQELFVSEANLIRKIDSNTCQTLATYNFGLSNSSYITSLSFDTNNNMYFGGFNSSVYRSSGNLTSYESWHNFGSGAAAGDFVIYSDKMYIAWNKDSKCKLYEVTLGSNNNYVSHVDLGELPNPTFGLASELGKLYGVHPDFLYEIDLNSLTFNTILTNNTGYDWYGAAGKNEGVSFSINAFETLTNAQNNLNPLPNSWINTVAGGQTIYISIINNLNNTTQIVPVNLIVNVAPSYVSPIAINHCYGDVDATIFDLRATENSIVGNQMNIAVSYHNSMNEAINNTNPLPDSYTLSGTDIKDIFVRLENTITGCLSYFNFKIKINSLPIFNQPDNLLYCYKIGQPIYIAVDLVGQIEAINAHLNPAEYSVNFYHSYQDALNQTNTISSQYFITVNQEEIFFTLTNIETTCFSVGSFWVNVQQENYNFIDNVSIETFDWTNNENSIAITVNGNGLYEYSLDGFYYQNEGLFTQLKTGIYPIYVRDTTTCSIFISEVVLLHYPYFFTPNNDGINDYWRIQFSEYDTNLTINIYDRFGKFLASLTPDEIGWNGMYQESQLPADDYWFVVKRENGKEYKGHFCLKR